MHACVHVHVHTYVVVYCMYEYVDQTSSQAFSLASRVIILVLRVPWYCLRIS